MSPPEVWGPPVWTLFHTLAEKIHEDKFNELGPSMISYIRRISRYLPCPECSQHATRFFSTTKPELYNTKKNFMNILYVLHNHINIRKHKRTATTNMLQKYKRHRVIYAYNNFIRVYHTKGNLNLLTDTFQRQLLIADFKKWIINNIQHFR